jgi:hypothetical protein
MELYFQWLARLPPARLGAAIIHAKKATGTGTAGAL